MPSFSLAHLSDSALDRGLESAARDASIANAWLLAHLAEFESRRLYAPAGYPSMTAYCVQHLRFSEDAAHRRIRVAGAARRFPAIFGLIASGQLHLTGVLLLAPHLTTENAEELLGATVQRTRSEIEHMIAERFPRRDVPEQIAALAVACGAAEEVHTGPALARVFFTEAGQTRGVMPRSTESAASVATPEPAPERVEFPTRVKPLSPERYALQCTVSLPTYEKLRRVQELLGHDVIQARLAEVLDRAFGALVRELEKRTCAATERPRAGRRAASKDSRHIPAAVKRAVWKRDSGRCTFVAGNGRRCEARTNLEIDHEVPFARGGASTAGNLRLRCRAHNQLEAERAFGAGFMEHKRRAAGAGRQAEEAGLSAEPRGKGTGTHGSPIPPSGPRALALRRRLQDSPPWPHATPPPSIPDDVLPIAGHGSLLPG